MASASGSRAGLLAQQPQGREVAPEQKEADRDERQPGAQQIDEEHGRDC